MHTMTSPVRPPMPYSGGKQRVADQIAAILDKIPHSGYVEPFAGALSVLLAKQPSAMETINDLDGDIVAFWRVLRDRPDELERVCALTPHARDEMLTARQRHDVDDLERARRVWVQLTQSRGARLTPSGWRFVHGGNGLSLSRYLTGYLARIQPAAERLKHVSLEHRPAQHLITAYGSTEENLLYLDPPYLAGTRYGPQYRHELATPAEHEELLASIVNLPAAVAISGYPHPLYDDILTGWTRHEFTAAAMSGAPRTEVLWTNRNPTSDAPTLLDDPDQPHSTR